jgi:hypothetical protein
VRWLDQHFVTQLRVPVEAALPRCVGKTLATLPAPARGLQAVPLQRVLTAALNWGNY